MEKRTAKNLATLMAAGFELLGANGCRFGILPNKKNRLFQVHDLDTPDVVSLYTAREIYRQFSIVAPEKYT